MAGSPLELVEENRRSRKDTGPSMKRLRKLLKSTKAAEKLSSMRERPFANYFGIRKGRQFAVKENSGICNRCHWRVKTAGCFQATFAQLATVNLTVLTPRAINISFKPSRTV